MSIEYLGLSEINGPLVVLEGVGERRLRRDGGIHHQRNGTENGAYYRRL